VHQLLVCICWQLLFPLNELFLLLTWSDPRCLFWLNLARILLFIRYEYSYSCIFWKSVCLENPFLAFYLKPMFVFVSEIHFLWSTNGQVLLVNPTCHSMSFDWRSEIKDVYILILRICPYVNFNATWDLQMRFILLR
jgi:hypothetical protein